MTAMCCGFLRGGWSRRCSVRPAIVTNVASCPREASHVSVLNHRDVHVIHGLVVVEGSVIPIAAPIADTTVAEAIVDPSVETDSWTPVARLPDVAATRPPPITGSPQQPDSGRLDPCARYPVVACRTISPVSGRPQITTLRAARLRVCDEFGRSDAHSYAQLGEQCGRYGQYQGN